jgi:hypothetical protein
LKDTGMCCNVDSRMLCAQVDHSANMCLLSPHLFCLNMFVCLLSYLCRAVLRPQKVPRGQQGASAQPACAA